METQTELAALLRRIFPAWQSLLEECWVRGAIDENWDYSADEVRIARRLGGEPGLIVRLALEHPTTRTHNRQHDDRLIDVLDGELTTFA